MTATEHRSLDRLDAQLREAEALTEGRVRLVLVPGLAQLHLSLGSDAAARRADLGVELPTAPNTWSAGPPDAHWLAPGEWLLVGARGTQQTLEDAIRAALPRDEDAWGAVVDVSDQRVALELAGPSARDLLAAGCALDLHPRSFEPLHCAQSTVGLAAVLLAQLDELPTYRLFVRRSFASYLVAWLMDGVAELSGTSLPRPHTADRHQEADRPHVR